MSASNFQLQSGSAMIDAGTNTGCPAADASGLARPSGARCDIGAFEFGGAVTVTAPGSPTNFRIIKQ